MRSWTSLGILLLTALLLVSAGCRSRSRGSRPDAPVPGRDAGPTTGDSGPVEPREDGGPVIVDDGGGCPEALTDCDGACVDTSYDPSHCGGCFLPCEGSCVEGTCTTSCTPSCSDRACGDDGCGGSCGSCPSGYFCSSGACVSSCTPSCSGLSCGDDGCGGSCGTCPSGYFCSGGECAPSCTPSCSGRTCGSDGCGGSCGTCSSGYTCSTSGSCVPDTPPPGGGESCSSPTSISASGGTRSFTFTGRVADHTPFSCGSTTGNPDVVFSWTPFTSGTASIRAAGPTTSTDTVLAVFSSSLCSSSYEVGCNDDDGSGGYSSLVTLSVTAGTNYYIAVAPYGTSRPTETITVTVTAP